MGTWRLYARSNLQQHYNRTGNVVADLWRRRSPLHPRVRERQAPGRRSWRRRHRRLCACFGGIGMGAGTHDRRPRIGAGRVDCERLRGWTGRPSPRTRRRMPTDRRGCARRVLLRLSLYGSHSSHPIAQIAPGARADTAVPKNETRRTMLQFPYSSYSSAY